MRVYRVSSGAASTNLGYGPTTLLDPRLGPPPRGPLPAPGCSRALVWFVTLVWGLSKPPFGSDPHAWWHRGLRCGCVPTRHARLACSDTSYEEFVITNFGEMFEAWSRINTTIHHTHYPQDASCEMCSRAKQNVPCTVATGRW
jgi:hypothetical protein